MKRNYSDSYADEELNDTNELSYAGDQADVSVNGSIANCIKLASNEDVENVTTNENNLIDIFHAGVNGILVTALDDVNSK